MNRYIKIFVPFKQSKKIFGFHIASNDNKITVLSFNSSSIVATLDSTLDKTSQILVKQDQYEQENFIVCGKDKILGKHIAQIFTFNADTNSLKLTSTAYLDNSDTSSITEVKSLEISQNSVFVGVDFSNKTYFTQILNRANLTYVVANVTDSGIETAPGTLVSDSTLTLSSFFEDKIFLHKLCSSELCLSCGTDECDACRPDAVRGFYKTDNFCYEVDHAQIEKGNLFFRILKEFSHIFSFHF